MMFGCGCSDRPIVNLLGGGWWGGGRGAAAHATLHSTSALLRPGTQSKPQVAQSVPFSSYPHASAMQNL